MMETLRRRVCFLVTLNDICGFDIDVDESVRGTHMHYLMFIREMHHALPLVHHVITEGTYAYKSMLH